MITMTITVAAVAIMAISGRVATHAPRTLVSVPETSNMPRVPSVVS